MATLRLGIDARDAIYGASQFQTALANARVGMDAVISQANQTSVAAGALFAAIDYKDEAAKIDNYTASTNSLGHGLLRLSSIANILGNQIGMTSGQLQILNLGLLALSGRTNLLATGGLARITASLAAIGPLGWAAIAVLTALGTAFAINANQTAKAKKELAEYTEFLKIFTTTMKSADEAMYGGKTVKVSGLEVEIEKSKELTKKYEESLAAKEKYESRMKETGGLLSWEEIRSYKEPIKYIDKMTPEKRADMDALLAKRKELEESLKIAEKVASAEQEAIIRTLELELSTSAAYKESNDYLRDRIGLNTDFIAAINEQQAAILGLGGEEKKNSTEYIALEQQKLEIQIQNANLFDEIADKKQKMAEATARAAEEQEKLNHEIEFGQYDKEREAVAAITAALQEEIATLGMASDELQIYQATQAGATEAELENIRALQQQKKTKEEQIEGNEEVKKSAIETATAIRQQFQSSLISGEDLWERIQTGLASSSNAAGTTAGVSSASGNPRTPTDMNTGEINRNTQNANTVLEKILSVLQDIKRSGFVSTYN